MPLELHVCRAATFASIVRVHTVPKVLELETICVQGSSRDAVDSLALHAHKFGLEVLLHKHGRAQLLARPVDAVFAGKMCLVGAAPQVEENTIVPIEAVLVLHGAVRTESLKPEPAAARVRSVAEYKRLEEVCLLPQPPQWKHFHFLCRVGAVTPPITPMEFQKVAKSEVVRNDGTNATHQARHAPHGMTFI